MTTVISGMLIAVLIAGVVVALVAVPARRAGRDVLTAQGEQIVQSALDRTVEAVEAARDKVGDLADKLPTSASRTDPTTDQGDSADPGRESDLRSQIMDSGQHRA